MGMFDFFEIDGKFLPENLKHKNTGWQTKSLDCCLDTITITEDGDLMLSKNYNFDVNPLKKIDYTGEIIFYQDIMEENEHKNVDNVWYEFVCIIVNGKLEDIKLKTKIAM